MAVGLDRKKERKIDYKEEQLGVDVQYSSPLAYLAEDGLDDGGAGGVGGGHIQGIELLPEHSIGSGVTTTEADNVVAEVQWLPQHHRRPYKWNKNTFQ